MKCRCASPACESSDIYVDIPLPSAKEFDKRRYYC